jgi:hypothetical protein
LNFPVFFPVSGNLAENSSLGTGSSAILSCSFSVPVLREVAGDAFRTAARHAFSLSAS